jgi:hypothetical protein
MGCVVAQVGQFRLGHENIVFCKVATSLQIILRHEVVEFLIEKIIQEKFRAKFQTIARG